MIRSIGLEALLLDNLLKASKKLGESLEDCVSACWVLLGEIIGILPLSDHVVSAGVVGSRVVVIDSTFNEQISELDTSCESSQIVGVDLVLCEEFEDLVGFWITDVQDLRSGDSGVVGAVGDWSGVVVTVKLVVHR